MNQKTDGDAETASQEEEEEDEEEEEEEEARKPTVEVIIWLENFALRAV